MCQFMWYAPWIGKGFSQTLHRNYLLAINSNIEEGEMDKPMVGDGNNISLTQVPSMDNVPAYMQDCLGWLTPSTAGSTPQGSLDQPALLRWWHLNHPESTPMEVPEFWFVDRYWNDQHLGCMGWPMWVCLHIVFCLYTIFCGSTV